MKKFPHFRQLDQMDCGPTCIRIVAKYYGKSYSLQKLRELSGIGRHGVSLLGISEAAESIGFRTTGAKINLVKLSEINMPVILHWDQRHFVVLYKIDSSRRSGERTYYISDPAKGLLRYNESEFVKQWQGRNSAGEGIILTLSPAPQFYDLQEDGKNHLDISYMLGYLKQYKGLFFQLAAGLGVGTLMQLILSFLTQSIVDIGINTRNLNFIYVVLIAQTMLFLGRISVDFIRSWILLHITTRLNIAILTDFLIKLMKLPMSFFETKMTGDIMQRMNDQGRIQSFLTGSTLNTVFSLFNLLMFALVLAYYNLTVFVIFVISTVIYSIWVILFMRQRRRLDLKRFDISSSSQNTVIQLISGMQEIKLSGCEQQKRWDWEKVQASLFKYSIKSLSLGQYQQLGAFFINEGKNILITFIVAKSVIDGNLTLGAMMAIQYVVGQLNSPIEQLISFMQSFQDAKISLERLNEIHEIADEDSPDQYTLNDLPRDKGLSLTNLSFSYPGAGNELVLNGVSLSIPAGKTTAIVGMSGSGKSTILKLLLRYYIPKGGDIKIGNSNIKDIGHKFWRSKCGVVMTDGFIFSDTIARNIAVGDTAPDITKLAEAINIANIGDFINDLPMGLNTKIGMAGNGISEGQKQRILIARAVYKNPDYLFFDEATNRLDANNERIIMENLETFFKGRTVVVVAHRLSTIRNADNIVVLDKGAIVEQGHHEKLIAAKGEYYQLVKNQLEIGI